MKIKLTKTKTGVNIKIAADCGEEGHDLKDAVLAMGKGGLDSSLELLAKRGYQARLTSCRPNMKVFALEKMA
jgi:hypothetical protein